MTMTGVAWKITAAALVIVTFSACNVSSQPTQGFQGLKEGAALNSNQENALPDMSDTDTLKKLKCTACQAAVMEMSYGILRQENEQQRKLREVEIIEILEQVCSAKMDEYGLALDPQTGNPSQVWSSDANTPRAKGGWVTRLATGTCADVYNEYEEYLTEEAPKSCRINAEGTHKTCNTRKIIAHICKDGFKWCKAGDIVGSQTEQQSAATAADDAVDDEDPADEPEL